MHKRILVPMDDSARAKAGLPNVQSPSIDARIFGAWKASISLTRAEYKDNPKSLLIRESSPAEVIPAVADAM